MEKNSGVTIKDFFLSLSTLLDVANKELSRHQLRTAFIAWKIGDQFGLKEKELNEVIIASLVHDIGALSLEEKVQLHSSIFEELDIHCIRGWYIVKKIDGFKNIANSIRYHHADYTILKDNYILAQIINLADFIERMIDRDKYLLHQVDDISQLIQNNIGTKFNPSVVNSYNNLKIHESFWFDLDNPNLKDIIKDSPLSSELLSSHTTIQLSMLIRDIIDFKSPFTVRHSTAVMIVTEFIAKILDLSKPIVDDLKLAGLMHDIGKLVVPTNIIMKNGPLTKEEMSIMKQHPYYTSVFLRSAHYPNNICEYASFHHENFKGTGYPFGLNNYKLDSGSRIIAISDIFVALSEDRPYRQALSKNEIKKIFDKFDKNSVDEIIISHILDNFDTLMKKIKISKQYLLNEYNNVMNLEPDPTLNM